MTTAVKFKFTFPIQKSEQRADGFYIVGEATGPEIDATNERMSPECIARFADQITSAASNGEPLRYHDAHKSDGVFAELGDITKAWITPDWHMGIEVKLDDLEQNAASKALWFSMNPSDSTRKAKQWGMSVAGRVHDFVDEWVKEAGKAIRTYKDIVLTEISNTTRPAWTPSFGTVLSKAIDEADTESDADEGENVQDTLQADDANKAAPVDADENTEDTAKADESEDATAEDETETEDTTAEKTDDDASAQDDAEKAAPEADDESEVEKAGRTLSSANAKRLLAMRAEIDSFLSDLGVTAEGAPAKSDSSDAENTLVKAEAVEKAALVAANEEFQRSLAEKTARIEELLAMPASAPPTLVRSGEDADEVIKAVAEMEPRDRLRLGLKIAHRG